MDISQLQKILMSHPLTAAPQAAKLANAKDATSPTSTATNVASISSNDFLTLLVAEMKNQDPTANTDPNQYINQLVQVNSLQQLIAINGDLTPSGTTTTTPTGGLATGSSAAIANSLSKSHAGTGVIGAAVQQLQPQPSQN